MYFVRSGYVVIRSATLSHAGIEFYLRASTAAPADFQSAFNLAINSTIIIPSNNDFRYYGFSLPVPTKNTRRCFLYRMMLADPTRLELATSAVTGRRSNQLSYESTNLYYSANSPNMQEYSCVNSLYFRNSPPT